MTDFSTQVIQRMGAKIHGRNAVVRVTAGQVANDMTATAQDQDKPRLTTVSILLEALATFVEKQLAFFTRGFALPEPTTGEAALPSFLDEDATYPPVYALQVTEQQMAQDRDLLMRIVGQRLVAWPPDIKASFAEADSLAYAALRPAMTYLDVEPTTVLTYFQKSASIRVIPYAPVMLIGLPLISTAATDYNYQDLLAIPHEVGHQVYWRRDLDETEPVKGQLRDRLVLEEFPTWIKHWQEEIFADVYSCLVAGPVSAYSIQRQLLAVSAPQFVEDDGEHPAPLVRPFVHSATLAYLANVPGDNQLLRNAAKALQKNWKDELDARQIHWFRPRNAGAPVTIAEAERQLSAVVDAMLDKIIVKEKWSDAVSGLWSQGLTSEEQLSELFKQFATFKGSVARKVPELTLENEQVKVMLDGAALNDFPLGATQLKFEKLRDYALTHGAAIKWDADHKRWGWAGASGASLPTPPPLEQASMRFPWWLEVLEAGGWTTGPGGPGNLRDFD